MLTALNITSIYVLDHDEALDFYVGLLGLEKRADVDLGFMRWVTVHVPGQPDREILLDRPGPPAMDEQTAAQVRDLLTKGALGTVIFETDDAQRTHERLRASGVEVTEEPTQRDYGIDFGFRDPFGNQLRVGETKRFRTD